MSLDRNRRNFDPASKSVLAALAITALVSAPALGQTVLYDTTYTGAELLTAPGVSFPTRTPTVVGTSLEFGTGVATFEVLIRLPLASAGAASTSSSVLACYEISFAPLTTDNDTNWLLGDGLFMAGGGVADNSGGTSNALSWDDPPVAPLEVITLFSGAGFPALGTSLDAAINVFSDDSTTTVETAFGTEANSANLAVTLDRTQALEFVLLGNDAGEQYRVDRVRARLVRDATGFENCSFIPAIPVVEIPTVSEWGLFLFALLLMAAGVRVFRRSRSKLGETETI